MNSQQLRQVATELATKLKESSADSLKCCAHLSDGCRVFVHCSTIVCPLRLNYRSDDHSGAEAEVDVMFDAKVSYSELIQHLHEGNLLSNLLAPPNDSLSGECNQNSDTFPDLCQFFGVPCFSVRPSESGTNAAAFTCEEISNGSKTSGAVSNLHCPVCFLETGGRQFAVWLDEIESDNPSLTHQCSPSPIVSSRVLQENTQVLLFTIYQILNGVNQWCQAGFLPPRLTSDNVLIQSTGWVVLSFLSSPAPEPANFVVTDDPQRKFSENPSVKTKCYEHWLSKPLWEATSAWLTGDLDNFNYLMLLNHFAKRSGDNMTSHFVFPWVVDFTSAEGGWRDLTKTKYRLTKGDKQLDQSFQSPGHLPPHHIPEILSDISCYVYKARNISAEVLCQHVRSQWVPEEYPRSIRRLYEWTPDECIPEFYCDVSTFHSSHSDMGDLQLPPWCIDADAFVKWHRGMLECEWVSQRLHHWIDLVFGDKLVGAKAVEAKNVMLHAHENTQTIIQLFEKPHPKRLGTAELALSTMDEMMEVIMSPLNEISQLPAAAQQLTLQSGVLGDVLDGIYKKQELSNKKGIETCLESLGVLVLQLLMPAKFHSIPTGSDLHGIRLRVGKQILSTQSHCLPQCIFGVTSALLNQQTNAVSTEVNLGFPLNAGLLLHSLFPAFRVPAYIHKLYEMLTDVAQMELNVQQIGCMTSDEIQLHANVAYAVIKNFSMGLTEILPSLDSDAMELIVPHLRFLMAYPLTAVSTAWELFTLCAPHLKPKKLAETFSNSILNLLNAHEVCTRKHLKLYHRNFLLYLMVWLGTKHFLESILPALLTAASGVRDKLIVSEERYYASLSGMASAVPDRQILDFPTDSNLETVSTYFENEYDLDEEAAFYDSVSLQSENSQSESENSLVQPATFEVEESNLQGTLVSGIAKETIVWLAHRLGPILTARFITRPLLQELAMSYMAEKHCAEQQSGDSCAVNLSGSLVEVAEIFGNSFILLQYFPYCAELIHQATKRLSYKFEAGMVSCLILVEHVLPCLSGKELLDCIQETLIDSILFPIVRLVSSLRIEFSSCDLRQHLTWKTVHVLHLLGLKLGGENVKRFMSAPLQRLLCVFDLLYNFDETTGDISLKLFEQNHSEVIATSAIFTQLQENFSQGFAQTIFQLFGELCGKQYFKLSLPNSDLIMSIISDQKTPDELGQPLSAQSQLMGNCISSLKHHASTSDELNVIHRSTMAASRRKLLGNWLACWEHALARNPKESSFYFHQIQLQSFVGHSAAVRRLYVMENENSFISASHDKTVRLWSMRSMGDGTSKYEARWVYRNHKKAILDLAFIESTRLVCSTDGTLQIWDPFMGSTLREYEWRSSNSSSGIIGSSVEAGVTFAKAFRAPSRLVLAASTEPIVRLLDVRMGQWCHEFRVASAPLGSCRSICVHPGEHTVAVGFNTGHISLVDLRIGKLLGSTRLADADICTMRPLNKDLFVVAQPDQCLTVMSASNCLPSHRIPGVLDGVHSIRPFASQLITAGSQNKVRIYSSADSNATFSESRIKSDVFAGHISTMEVLPLNRQLLIGSSNGAIQLLC